MKTCVAIRHVPFEDLGAFEGALVRRGWRIRYLQAGVDDVAEAETADLLVILGGPINADDVASYPFLSKNFSLITARIESGRPVMGICLGAQMIAQAAGARVTPGRRAEIGFAPITLTEAGLQSCLAPFGDDPMTLHWHGDVFDLPSGARRLAWTDDCPNQAFDLGPGVIGFQFHPEADARALEPWLIGHAVELQARGVSPGALRADAAEIGDRLARKAHAVLERWLDGLDGSDSDFARLR